MEKTFETELSRIMLRDSVVRFSSFCLMHGKRKSKTKLSTNKQHIKKQLKVTMEFKINKKKRNRSQKLKHIKLLGICFVNRRFRISGSYKFNVKY